MGRFKSSPFIANAITTETLEPRLGCQRWREFNLQNSVSASSQTPRSPPLPSYFFRGVAVDGKKRRGCLQKRTAEEPYNGAASTVKTSGFQ